MIFAVDSLISNTSRDSPPLTKKKTVNFEVAN